MKPEPLARSATRPHITRILSPANNSRSPRSKWTSCEATRAREASGCEATSLRSRQGARSAVSGLTACASSGLWACSPSGARARTWHTCFWWGKVRSPNINKNRTFKDYYTLFKNTTPKEDKPSTWSIRKFNLI